MTRSTITVQGMHRSSCSILIDEPLKDLPGVSAATTDLRREVTTFDYDPAPISLDDGVGREWVSTNIRPEIGKLGLRGRSLVVEQGSLSS